MCEESGTSGWVDVCREGWYGRKRVTAFRYRTSECLDQVMAGGGDEECRERSLEWRGIKGVFNTKRAPAGRRRKLDLPLIAMTEGLANGFCRGCAFLPYVS